MKASSKTITTLGHLRFVALVSLVLAGTVASHAQITNLGSFCGTANGANPYGSLTLSGDGSTLYGTTEGGGANGDGGVFSVPVSGGTPTDLADFNSTNGAGPIGDLTLIGSTLYGTASEGGANGDGTVFSVAVPAPEPGSATLLVAGLFAASLLRRRAAVV